MTARSGIAAAALCAAALLTAASPAAARRAPAGFLGVGPATTPSAAEFQRMKAGGAATVRIQLSWPAIQPEQAGPYNWGPVDQQVAGAAAAGIKVLPFVFGTPAWAADCSAVNPSVCDRVLPTRSATGEAGWKSFLTAAVKRYGPTGTLWTDATDAFAPPYAPIDTWQIWNEENSVEFAPPTGSSTAYLQLLQISNQTIKNIDPGAQIMLGGLFRPVRRFLTDLYAAGAKTLFDAVALHPYSANLDQLGGQLAQARKVMRRNGDAAKPVWLTELGWGSAKSKRRVPLQLLLVGVNGQARMLRQSLNFLVAKRSAFGLRGVIWFTWRDVPGGTGGRCLLCESAGLFTASGAPKPAWRAFTQIAGGVP